MTFFSGVLISSIVWLFVCVCVILFASTYSIYNGKSDYFNWSEGFTSGWNDGYKYGMDVGLDHGYDAGFHAGMERVGGIDYDR